MPLCEPTDQVMKTLVHLACLESCGGCCATFALHMIRLTHVGELILLIAHRFFFGKPNIPLRQEQYTLNQEFQSADGVTDARSAMTHQFSCWPHSFPSTYLST